MKRNSSRPILILAMVVATIFGAWKSGLVSPPSPRESAGLEHGDQMVAEAFKKRASNAQIQGKGTVSKILADDNQGSRHQRFLVKLASGHSLLIAHNIDLAPRIEALKVGDAVEFHGEYEWNPQGGVIHWTHHDPKGRHVAGWLRYQGKTYQ